MLTVTCPYKGCRWEYKGFFERAAELAREAHIAICTRSPRRGR